MQRNEALKVKMPWGPWQWEPLSLIVKNVVCESIRERTGRGHGTPRQNTYLRLNLRSASLKQWCKKDSCHGKPAQARIVPHDLMTALLSQLKSDEV